MNINQMLFFVFQSHRAILQLYALILKRKKARFHLNKYKNINISRLQISVWSWLNKSWLVFLGFLVKGLRVQLLVSIERSHFPSLNLLLFLSCKSGLRIKIPFDIYLGDYSEGSSHIEAYGRIQI